VLKESERKFFEVFHSNPDAMVITRLSDGVCLEVNEAYTQMYGFLASEIVGRSLGQEDIGIWVENEERVQFEKELIANKRASGWEETHRRKDGTTFIASQSTSIIDIGGVACVLSIIRDVSARVEAERAVRRSEELLSTLMNSLPDLVFVKDRASRYQRVNKAFANITGVLNPKELIGKATEDTNPQELSIAYRSDDAFVMETGQSIINKEEEIEDAKGVRGMYLTTKAPLRDASGNIVGMVGISRDITERQEFQTHLQ
jgi:PAS domain S-box-containing protein